MLDIIAIVIASAIFVLMVIVIFKANVKFEDKSMKIKKGVLESEVREIMEDDPFEIEYLKDGNYEWIYQKKQWKGWGMMIIRIEIIFDIANRVIDINRSKNLEKEAK